MVIHGIEQIMTSMVECFGLLYTAAYFIYDFFITPLQESYPGIDEFLGADIAAYSLFELMFGPGLILIVVMLLVKSFASPL